MRGHAISDQQRRDAVAIIITHPLASIAELTRRIGALPHGTVGNIRQECVRAGLVKPLRDEHHLTSELREQIVADYLASASIRETARLAGVSYYTVRLALSLERVDPSSAARFVRPPVNARRGADLPTGSDVLEVLCWCEDQVLRVDRERVRRGETASCGRAQCEPAQGDDVRQ